MYRMHTAACALRAMRCALGPSEVKDLRGTTRNRAPLPDRVAVCARLAVARAHVGHDGRPSTAAGPDQPARLGADGSDRASAAAVHAVHWGAVRPDREGA